MFIIDLHHLQIFLLSLHTVLFSQWIMSWWKILKQSIAVHHTDNRYCPTKGFWYTKVQLHYHGIINKLSHRKLLCYRLSTILKRNWSLLNIFCEYSWQLVLNDWKNAHWGKYLNESGWRLCERCESCCKHLCCWFCLKTPVDIHWA